MDSSPEGVEIWNYHIPWRDLIPKNIIKKQMRYDYQYQFAKKFGLDPGDLSKIINEKGRLGTPDEPENLRKMAEGFILGEYPYHPPAIRSEAQLSAFLAAVPITFWPERYESKFGWQVFQNTGKPWIEQAVADAFAMQRKIWTANPAVELVIQMAMPACKNKVCNQLKKDLSRLLIQLCEQPEQSAVLVEQFVQRWSQGTMY